MIPISEKLHVKRLNENNLVIEDRFLNSRYSKEKILVRATDLLRDDSIVGCRRIEKVYFHNGKCIYVEKDFDPNTLYTYLVDRKDNKYLDCPSCGYHGTSKEFSFGCPYCNSSFGTDFLARRKNKIFRLLSVKTMITIYMICLLIISILSFIVSELNLLSSIFFSIPISFFFSNLCDFVVLYFRAYI